MAKRPTSPLVGKVTQVYDGKPVKMWYRKDGSALEYIICCDCGLVHLESFEPKKRYLKVTSWRDESVTKRFRRKREKRVAGRYKEGLRKERGRKAH